MSNHPPHTPLKPSDYSALITSASAQGDVEAVRRHSRGLNEAIAREQDAAAAAAARVDAHGERIIPSDEFNGLGADELATLQEGDPDLYARSLAAAAADGDDGDDELTVDELVHLQETNPEAYARVVADALSGGARPATLPVGGPAS